MKLISSIIFIALYCFPLIGCQHSSTNSVNKLPERPRFYMAISSHEMDLQNDSDIAVGGSDWGGSVVIYINGNPKDIIAYGGMLTYLTYYIKPGENIISLQGNTSENIYIKIFEMTETFGVKKVFAADKITPDKINEYRKVVILDTAYTPDFYFGDAPNQNNSRLEMQDIVVGLHDALIEKQRRRFERVITVGAKKRSSTKMGKEIHKSIRKSIKRRYFSGGISKYYEFDKKDIKIILGERTALVYCGIDMESNFRTPYLFRFKTKNCKSYGRSECEMTIEMNPLDFAYINNKWSVWESNI